jgi:hypothetical protein
VDSGSQVPLIRADRLHDNLTTTGSIYIQGIVGPTVQAKIATLDVTRWEEGVVSPSVKIPQLRIAFAIMEEMVGHDVILPTEVADKIMRSEIDQSDDRTIAWVVDIGGQTTDIVDDKPGMSAGKGKSEISETPNIDLINPCKNGDCENGEFTGLASWSQHGGVCTMGNLVEDGIRVDTSPSGLPGINAEGSLKSQLTETGPETTGGKPDFIVSASSRVKDASGLNSGGKMENVARSDAAEGVVVDAVKPSKIKIDLREEQSVDTTLSSCRKLANQNKGGFEWRNGILFHNDHVMGQRVEQLCVPLGRRPDLLELAHIQGGHLG